MSGAYRILFEVGIPNVVGGYILGLRSVMYCFQVGGYILDLLSVMFCFQVTLTWSQLKKNWSYLIYHLRYETLIWFVDTSWVGECLVLLPGHCDLDLWPLSSRNILSRAYLLYFFR